MSNIKPLPRLPPIPKNPYPKLPPIPPIPPMRATPEPKIPQPAIPYHPFGSLPYIRYKYGKLHHLTHQRGIVFTLTFRQLHGFICSFMAQAKPICCTRCSGVFDFDNIKSGMYPVIHRMDRQGHYSINNLDITCQTCYMAKNAVLDYSLP